MINVEMPDGTVVQASNNRVKDILKELGQNENAVLVVFEDNLATPDIILKAGSSIRLISVVSGG